MSILIDSLTACIVLAAVAARAETLLGHDQASPVAMETRPLPWLDGRGNSYAGRSLHRAGGRGKYFELYSSRGSEASESEASEWASDGDGGPERGMMYTSEVDVSTLRVYGRETNEWPLSSMWARSSSSVPSFSWYSVPGIRTTQEQQSRLLNSDRVLLCLCLWFYNSRTHTRTHTVVVRVRLAVGLVWTRAVVRMYHRCT